jgi:hypothetical protein
MYTIWRVYCLVYWGIFRPSVAASSVPRNNISHEDSYEPLHRLILSYTYGDRTTAMNLALTYHSE